MPKNYGFVLFMLVIGLAGMSFIDGDVNKALYMITFFLGMTFIYVFKIYELLFKQSPNVVKHVESSSYEPEGIPKPSEEK